MNLIEKLSNWLRTISEKSSKRRLIENAAIIVVVGIVLILAGSTLLKKDNSDKESKDTENIKSQQKTTIVSPIDNKDALETKLENILMQMEGVGKASVMITYISGIESVPAYDINEDESTTKEKDTSGGTREIGQYKKQDTVVYEQKGGDKKPVILKDLQPIIKGVVVMADGASSAQVRENIFKAVKALTDVPAHRIQIFERKNN